MHVGLSVCALHGRTADPLQLLGLCITIPCVSSLQPHLSYKCVSSQTDGHAHILVVKI